MVHWSYNEWFPNKKQWARKVTKFLQIFKNKTPKTFWKKVVETIPMISTDLYYAKDQYDKRQEMWWSYWETPQNFYTIWHDRISHPSIERDAKDQYWKGTELSRKRSHVVKHVHKGKLIRLNCPKHHDLIVWSWGGERINPWSILQVRVPLWSKTMLYGSVITRP